MDLSYSPQEERFRAELRAWLEQHPPGPEPERIDELVSKIVRELESQGESEISSETIGETVMEHLRALDDVAYVRFASVYRNFREAKDFEAVLGELSGDEDGKPPAAARK
jgi:transcriptional repressor NrdR